MTKKTSKKTSLLLIGITAVAAIIWGYTTPKNAEADSTIVYKGVPVMTVQTETEPATTVEEVVSEQNETEETDAVQENVTKVTKYVTATSLNVRKSPAGDIVTSVPFNTELEVIEHRADGWTSIAKDGAILYVKTEHLSDTKSEAAPTPGPNMVLWKNNVKLTYYHAKGLDAHDNQLDPNYTVASNVLPQYTKLYIEGIGYRTVMDTGSSVLNDGRVDICCPTYNNKDCLAYASKMPQRANVYIVTD